MGQSFADNGTGGATIVSITGSGMFMGFGMQTTTSSTNMTIEIDGETVYDGLYMRNYRSPDGSPGQTGTPFLMRFNDSCTVEIDNCGRWFVSYYLD